MKIACSMVAGGGKTVPSNSRPVQWQVKQAKQNKLEFLVPWWDLQLGVSVNQFLSIFASKNADFRSEMPLTNVNQNHSIRLLLFVDEG